MPESFPKWIAEEISGAKLEFDKKLSLSGYPLDLNEKERKVDVQFHDKLPDGRYIATLDLPKEFSPSSLKLGEGFFFELNVFKADLSEKVVDYLDKQYSVKMSNIFRFELLSAEIMDVT
ncbi:MAG: hypothetical protein V3U49_01885 [Nitrososphaerales archaeon]